MKQMMALQEKVEAIQSSRNEVLNSRHKSDGEREDGDRRTDLTDWDNEEAAFSGTMTKVDRKKWVEKMGVPNCDKVAAPNWME